MLMVDLEDNPGWSALRHAYGQAADTPGLLKALSTADAEQRADAADQLSPITRVISCAPRDRPWRQRPTNCIAHLMRGRANVRTFSSLNYRSALTKPAAQTACDLGSYLRQFRSAPPALARALADLAHRPQARDAALWELEMIGEAARPALDVVVELATHEPAGRLGPAGQIAVRLEAKAALPLLRAALGGDDRAAWWPSAHSGALLPKVADLVGPRVTDTRPEARQSALFACATCETVARVALPHVGELLTSSPDLATVTVDYCLRALAKTGRRGRGYVDLVRSQCGNDVPEIRAQAIATLYDLGVTSTEVLSRMREELSATVTRSSTRLLELASAMGRKASVLVPQLVEQVPGARSWQGVRLARALWAVGGDREQCAGLLAAAWNESRALRAAVAQSFAVMRHAAAVPLLREELADPIRSRWSPTALGTMDVTEDERLMRTCRNALKILDS